MRSRQECARDRLLETFLARRSTRRICRHDSTVVHGCCGCWSCSETYHSLTQPYSQHATLDYTHIASTVQLAHTRPASHASKIVLVASTSPGLTVHDAKPPERPPYQQWSIAFSAHESTGASGHAHRTHCVVSLSKVTVLFSLPSHPFRLRHS